MVAAFQGTDYATASKYLKGFTNLTMRHRLLLAFYDAEGRINRDATGKDLNWLMQYKLPTAGDYTPGQQFNFANDNYNLPASQLPSFMFNTSAIGYVDQVMNSGPTMIVDNFKQRTPLLVQSMQNKLVRDLYSYGPNNTKAMPGLQTMSLVNTTTALCTHADRLAVPAGTVHGLTLAPGSYGGSWSNVLPSASQMSTTLGSDWPDGQGSPDGMYDATSPRLYNENCNQWLTPGAAAADSTWAANCIAILSRSNTDLKMNSVKTMMPTVHITAGQRYQAVKDLLRTSFRDTQTSNKAAETLGYYDVLSLEGAAIDLDYECPADHTFSLCAESMDFQFFGNPSEMGGKTVAGATGDAAVTGGIFTMFGPERPAGSAEMVWILLAGGMPRYTPKWFVAIADFTAARTNRY